MPGYPTRKLLLGGPETLTLAAAATDMMASLAPGRAAARRGYTRPGGKLEIGGTGGDRRDGYSCCAVNGG